MRMGSTTALAMAVLVLAAGTGGSADGPATIRVTTADGKAVPLLAEDLTGLSARPLVKMRDALDKKLHSGFLSLCRVQAKVGTELVGVCTVDVVPCRLTVYEISKRAGAGRELRVVATGYYDKPEKAVFRKKVEAMEENVFFLTAETVSGAGELNSHLRYMESQGNAILLKGYSSNWNLTALKLKMAGKSTEQGQEEEGFEKDGHWLVDQLIRPLWLVSVRVESE